MTGTYFRWSVDCLGLSWSNAMVLSALLIWFYKFKDLAVECIVKEL